MLPGYARTELHLECAFRYFGDLRRYRVPCWGVDGDLNVLEGPDDVGERKKGGLADRGSRQSVARNDDVIRI